jgi:hypothetical protein
MRMRAVMLALVAATVAAACAEVNLGPNVPASITFAPVLAPAIAIGDSLRDANGVAVPIRAAVLNQDGDTLRDAVVTYTYVDINNDTALVIDPVTGFVFARKALTNATTARIAARVGLNLQTVRTLALTTRPDSIDRIGQTAIDTFRVTVPDTSATLNTSPLLTLTVRHKDTTKTPVAVTNVAGWLVKYTLLYPSNPNNDSTRSVFLVNENRRASSIDTTDGSGIAGRSVRVRSGAFPSGTAPDSAVVEVSVTFRGQPVIGSPMVLKLPIVRRAASTP